jgi:hypothetical protein
MKLSVFYLSFLLFPLLCEGSTHLKTEVFSVDSTVNLQDSNQMKLSVDRSDYIITGLGTDFRDYQLVFNNIIGNMIGDLQFGYDDHPRNLDHWEFSPSINQRNIFLFATTRYGSFAYSKSILSDGIVAQTEAKSLSFNIPLGFLNLSFESIKFTGMNRIDPLIGQKVFLKDLKYAPLNIHLDIIGERIKNPYLHIPKKSIFSVNTFLGYTRFVVKNPVDFISAIQYSDASKTTVEYVDNVYINEFTSKGFLMGAKAGFILSIIKPRLEERPKALYIKGLIRYTFNFQKFEFHAINPGLLNSQHADNGDGFEILQNLNGNATLVGDLGGVLFGLGSSCYYLVYGNGSGEASGGYALDLRISHHAFLAFRFGFKKAYAKIEGLKK